MPLRKREMERNSLFCVPCCGRLACEGWATVALILAFGEAVGAWPVLNPFDEIVRICKASAQFSAVFRFSCTFLSGAEAER